MYQYGMSEYLISNACFIICCASHENDAGSWSYFVLNKNGNETLDMFEKHLPFDPYHYDFS